MTYDTDAADTHLSNAYWCLDTGDIEHNVPSDENMTVTTNAVFITRWNRLSSSSEVPLFDRLNSDICNMPLYLLPGVRFQIRFTNARPKFCLKNKSVDYKPFSNFWTPNYWSDALGRTRYIAGSQFDTEQGEF